MVQGSEIIKKVKELQNIDLDDKLLRLSQEIHILEKASKKEDINKIKKTSKEMEKQLDKEVYSIYGLSKTEIRVIEELE